jgi:hypothetical protein
MLQDYVLAHVYFDLAAALSEKEQQRKFSAGFRDVVAKLMTPAQLADAQRLASERSRR